MLGGGGENLTHLLGFKARPIHRLGTPLQLAAGVRLELTSFSVNSGVLSPGKLTSIKLCRKK